MQAQFTEQGEHERGFADVFRREIVPIVDRHEEMRKAASRKAVLWITVSIVVGALGAALLFAIGIWNFAIMAGVVGVIAAFGVFSHHQKKWQTGLSAEIMPLACTFLGELEYGKQRIEPAQFSALGVVETFSGMTLEDPVNGTHAGLSYAMTEARLTQRRSSGKSGSKTVTVFKGLLIRIELATPAPSIFFARDRGGVGNWIADRFSAARRGRRKLEIGDPEFEATYETYADDEVAAREFITPRLTSGLMEVARAEAGRDYISAALSGRHLWLALPRKGEFLTLGALFRPLRVGEEDIHALLTDLMLPRRVIDALRGPNP